MAIALVTGTSSGIGLATAVTLARGGHTVIATMRNPESAGELQKIVTAEKLPVTMATLNVDDDASVESAFAKVMAQHGRLDVLVNNAGIGGGGSVEESSAARFREVMETNFFGALRCIKAVLPGMRQRRQGCIVNVTSIAGRMALAPAAAYSASKFALEALSECLAQEMKAFNVRVAVVEPGVIATPIFSKAAPVADDSPYPHYRRQRAMFAQSLTKPTSPYVVGDKIREIVDSDSWQLRYPVGPDAAPFLQWRASKTDEEVIDIGAASDADYILMVKREFGIDVNL
ncbi:SDR family oxidoreductase [Bradyrhizobium erythrophlei]|jgi:NAD(P)-dependent dehydrogenase (short-subunit alcohol dehydrogenase family)|uniref:Short-chain dehydrogenase n=1 Tax=Bradyrhizobium erythrophlei TaxID=1437360 RepID=A0A1M5JJA2_9BRAD|nr:SDR family oxidoreductase [Bradyrhizobium erythrophlei]SHG40666.1 Short-chain dehydrogenase [Bradyrhizobium erythrophlei]